MSGDGGGGGGDLGGGGGQADYGGKGGGGGDYSGGVGSPTSGMGGEAPGLPGVSSGGGYDPGALPSVATPTSGPAPSGISDPWGLGASSSVAGSDFGYLNAPGLQSSSGEALPGASYGGQVQGYGTTDLGTGGNQPNLNTSPNTNVVTGSPTGQSAAPGLPGVGGGSTDLSSANRTTGSTGAGKPESDSIMKSLGISNPLGAAVGAAGLGFNMAQGQKPPAFTPQMKAQADQLSTQGQQLMSYLQSGNLPPGLKAGLDQATAAAKAKIISNFAAQGLNTDPTQNSALASQLAAVDQQALISTAQIGEKLLQTGVTETGLSSDLYKTLAQIDQTQTANIGKAIANFAQAISGSGGGTTIKVGG